MPGRLTDQTKLCFRLTAVAYLRTPFTQGSGAEETRYLTNYIETRANCKILSTTLLCCTCVLIENQSINQSINKNINNAHHSQAQAQIWGADVRYITKCCKESIFWLWLTITIIVHMHDVPTSRVTLFYEGQVLVLFCWFNVVTFYMHCTFYCGLSFYIFRYLRVYFISLLFLCCLERN